MLCWKTKLNPVGYGLQLHALPRLRVDDPNFRMAGSNLCLKPLPRVFVAVAQKDRAGLDLADKIEQLIAIGMSGQIETFQFATAG